MDQKTKEKKARMGHRWIRGESGTSYLCPIGAIDEEHATEEELRAACIDESRNPQND